MRARLFWLDHVQRLIIGGAAAFVSYKTIVAAVSSRTPGQPFYAFTARDWFEWVCSPGEALLILGATPGEYMLLSFALSKLLNTKRSGLLGCGNGTLRRRSCLSPGCVDKDRQLDALP